MVSKAARRYSIAFYGLAEEKGKLEEVAKDISTVLDMLKSNRQLELFFESPIISKNKKNEVVKDVFEGKISKESKNFIDLLVLRGREKLLKDIFIDFLNLKKEKEGIVDVFVKTSVPLSDGEKAEMKKKLDSFTKLKSDMNFDIDKDIIGGFVAQINDTILDASIKRQLERLRTKFREGDFVLN